ncbi:hypothetical protein L9F63_016759, partial [Diploptera punctata]
ANGFSIIWTGRTSSNQLPQWLHIHVLFRIVENNLKVMLYHYCVILKVRSWNGIRSEAAQCNRLSYIGHFPISVVLRRAGNGLGGASQA